MSEAYYLSESDVELFRAMAAEFRGRRPTLRYPPAYDEHQAPEVYAALTPPGGIPGLTPTLVVGTGTGVGAGNLPGSAFCDLYRVLKVPGQTEEMTPLGVDSLGTVLQKRVYNLSESVVPGRTWIAVMRDKYGTWYAAGALGGMLTNPGSGNSVAVLTGVAGGCDVTGHVVVGGVISNLSGYVLLNGIHYPVVFALS